MAQLAFGSACLDLQRFTETPSRSRWRGPITKHVRLGRMRNGPMVSGKRSLGRRGERIALLLLMPLRQLKDPQEGSLSLDDQPASARLHVDHGLSIASD